MGFLIHLTRLSVPRGNVMLVYSYWPGKNSVVCQANNSLLEEELQHCKQNQVGASAPTGQGDAGDVIL